MTFFQDSPLVAMESRESAEGYEGMSLASGRHAVVLFDGVCNFCNGCVQFILPRDHNALFRFAPLQSPAAAELLKNCRLPSDRLDTIVLVDGESCYTKSTAALRIAKKLSGLWPLLYALILIPRPLRDWLYDGFAKRRYRWFGKRDSCFIPTGDMKDRFLE